MPRSAANRRQDKERHAFGPDDTSPAATATLLPHLLLISVG